MRLKFLNVHIVLFMLGMCSTKWYLMLVTKSKQKQLVMEEFKDS